MVVLTQFCQILVLITKSHGGINHSDLSNSKYSNVKSQWCPPHHCHYCCYFPFPSLDHSCHLPQLTWSSNKLPLWIAVLPLINLRSHDKMMINGKIYWNVFDLKEANKLRLQLALNNAWFIQLISSHGWKCLWILIWLYYSHWETDLTFNTLPYLPVYNLHPYFGLLIEKKKKGSRKQRKWLWKNSIKTSWFGNTLKTTTRSSL